MSFFVRIFFSRFVFQAPSESCFTHLPSPYLHPPPIARTFSHRSDSPLIINSEIRMCNLDSLLCVTGLPQRPELCTYWPSTYHVPQSVRRVICQTPQLHDEACWWQNSLWREILHFLSNNVLLHLQMTSLFLVGGSRDKKHRSAKWSKG